MKIDKKPFGRLPDGSAASLFVVKAPGRIEVTISDYGGIVTSVRVPDRDGTMGEVTIGFDTLDQYLAGHPYYGATIGRVGNRVSGGGFDLDGRRYEITRNQDPVHLHGGAIGFDKKLFACETVSGDGFGGVRLTLVSPDGDEGYPGELTANVTIAVTEEGTLSFDYEATTSAPTPINLTNHTYWNLSGSGRVLDHIATINADRIVAVDDLSVPTGELPDVGGTAFDFRNKKAIGRDFDDVSGLPQKGYDHCYAVNGWNAEDPTAMLDVARVVSPNSGRRMTVHSTCPGVQFYTGNKLATARGRDGGPLSPQAAFCLETQFYPDSVNRPEFPESILRPGESWKQRSEYVFDIVE